MMHNRPINKVEANELYAYYVTASRIDGTLPQEDRLASIKERLNLHEKWLETKGANGAQFVANGENITGVDFSHRNLSCAEFNRCILSACNFYDTTFGEVALGSGSTRFDKCTIEKSIFVHACLTGCRIFDSIIADCNFNDAKLVRVYASGTWQFNGLDVNAANGNNFNYCDIADSTFTYLDFANSTFEKCKLYLVGFNYCNIGPIDFSKSAPVSSMLFNNCKMLGANFSNLLIEGSRFIDCRLKAAIFRRTLAKQSDFSGSSLDGADFGNADVSQCIWNRVSAYKTQFVECGMHDSEARSGNFRLANFSNCALYNSDLSGSDLLGAIIDGTTNKNMVNFSGCTWINGKRCKAGSLSVCYEE